MPKSAGNLLAVTEFYIARAYWDRAGLLGQGPQTEAGTPRVTKQTLYYENLVVLSETYPRLRVRLPAFRR